MRKRPTRPDDENPEWTVEMIREARPLREVLPALYEERVDRDVAEALRSSGQGWQTRANGALRAYAAKSGLMRERRPPYATARKRARAIRAK